MARPIKKMTFCGFPYLEGPDPVSGRYDEVVVPRLEPQVPVLVLKGAVHEFFKTVDSAETVDIYLIFRSHLKCLTGGDKSTSKALLNSKNTKQATLDIPYMLCQVYLCQVLSPKKINIAIIKFAKFKPNISIYLWATIINETNRQIKPLTVSFQ